MHQNWDQISTDLQYGPPVAKASRRSYQNDLADKGFLDFLLADNAQLPAPAPAPPATQQQPSSFDLAYGSNQIGAQPQNDVFNDGPFMSQQRTFHWVPTPGASEPSVPDQIAGPSNGVGETVGHKHKRVEESANSGHSNDDFGLGSSAPQLQHSGEHSGSDYEDNRKLTKAERTARMREKNKTAQKRWRDRQKVHCHATKLWLCLLDSYTDYCSPGLLHVACDICLQAKLTDSEKKLSELSAKLEHLAIEKSALENRNNILEKVLIMRDQEICKYKAEDHTARRQVGHSASLLHCPQC